MRKPNTFEPQILITQNNKIMAQNDRILTIVSEINDSTNNIAADIDKVLAQLADGTVTEESIQALEAASAKLKEVAAKVPEDGENTSGL